MYPYLDWRGESDPQDVSILQLVAIFLCDVAKLCRGVCAGRVRVLEGVPTGVLDVPLAADVLDDGREVEVLCHVEEERLLGRQRGLGLDG